MTAKRKFDATLALAFQIAPGENLLYQFQCYAGQVQLHQSMPRFGEKAQVSYFRPAESSKTRAIQSILLKREYTRDASPFYHSPRHLINRCSHFISCPTLLCRLEQFTFSSTTSGFEPLAASASRRTHSPSPSTKSSAFFSNLPGAVSLSRLGR